MYVKWQVKKRSSAWHSRGNLLTATLVECRRIEGKPRQQVVAYLGSVRLDYVGQHTEFQALKRHVEGGSEATLLVVTQVELPQRESVLVVSYRFS